MTSNAQNSSGGVPPPPATGGGTVTVTPAEVPFAHVVDAYECPHCGRSFGGAGSGHPGAPLTRVPCPQCAAQFLVPGRLGNFVLVEQITSDGLGDVYRASDPSVPVAVAVRVIPPIPAVDAALRDRLYANVRQASQIGNPHLPQVQSIGLADGRHFIVMELVSGEKLEDRLRSVKRMPERDVLRLALGVADGLAALHDAGLSHGNVSPANIVLHADGSAQLSDIGLLGSLRRDARGRMIGTPLYMAPELIQGRVDTPRSDIYSLGVTLYSLLTGQPPFAGKTPDEIFRAHLVAVVFPVSVHVPSLSVPTREIIGRMLKRAPAERYADCHAIIQDVRNALQALDAPPPAVLAPVPVPAPRAAPAQSEEPHPSQVRPVFVLSALVTLGACVVCWEFGPFDVAGWFRSDPTAFMPPPGPDPIVRSIPVPATEATASPPPVFGSAAIAAVATCTRRMKPAWQSSNLGNSLSHGITLWRGDAVSLIGDGAGIGGTNDDCRFVHVAAGATQVFSLRATRIAAAHPRAKSGILVRGSESASAPCVFFGFSGDGNLLLECRREQGQPMETTRTAPMPISRWHASYLQLECNEDKYRASVSRDGRNWSLFGACETTLPEGGQVGIALASETPGVMDTAEFADIRLFTPPSAPTAGPVSAQRGVPPAVNGP